jgi:hypothetical protein
MNRIDNEKHIICFGMYKNRVLEDIISENPKYILWAHNNVCSFTLSERLEKKAQDCIVALKKGKQSSGSYCGEDEMDRDPFATHDDPFNDDIWWHDGLPLD